MTIEDKNGKKGEFAEIRAFCHVPFEPKPGSEEMRLRDRIRAAVLGLKAEKNEILFAQYGDYRKKKSGSDLENLLFYNIGTGYFKSACKNGIAFSRCASEGEAGEVLYRYGMVSAERLHLKNAAAEWENIPLERFGGALTPACFWKAMKAHSENIKVNCRETVRDHFGVEIHIDLPLETRVNVASIMKPMLDGIICVFHAPKFEAEEFSQKLSCPADYFCGSESSILPPREYLRHYRGGIKWDPADDKCEFAVITVSRKDTSSISVSGKLAML